LVSIVRILHISLFIKAKWILFVCMRQINMETTTLNKIILFVSRTP
jgi:hypothetical protein